MKKDKRKLKIHAKHQSRPEGIYVIVPEIKLIGNWLSNFGFHHGQSVLITCEENKIVITIE